MERILRAVTAATILAMATFGSAFAANSQQDFSKLDPTWAAQETDKMLREGDLGSAWAALKAVFPKDYQQLTLDMANAIIQHRDWREMSQAFIQNHLAGQLPAAQNAPADQQTKYQRRKAEFLAFLSQNNVEACAYLGTGIGDPSSLGSMNSAEMKQYSDLLALTVETIGAGLRKPTPHGDLTADDVLKIRMTMTSLRISDEDVQRVLSGETGRASSELCRAGVIKSKVLAAAPADIVAKVAFR